MSTAAEPKSPATRAIRGLALVMMCVLLLGLVRAVPSMHGVGTIAAVGCLLLGGTLLAELTRRSGFRT